MTIENSIGETLSKIALVGAQLSLFLAVNAVIGYSFVNLG